MSNRYSFFTSNELKPKGWLCRQLRLEADGLCGNLDRVWPDVRDSAWIGGNSDGWERVPYWLDGFVPLAYLLEDEKLIARVKFYIDNIIKRQEDDGWICPVSLENRKNYDAWAILLMSKVFVRYYECSHDERIPDVLYRMMKNYYTMLSNGDISLGSWGNFRWFEGFPALIMLKKMRPEPWLDELANMLRTKGIDYGKLEERWKTPLNKWTYETHIVNLCMMIKSEVLCCTFFNEEPKGAAEHFFSVLDKYNGTAVGTFTGDECLSGISPTQGTELCSVVELMDSLEQIYAYTGDAIWAERLEKTAFNALPATITEDMWAHQYVQMVNQIDCTPFPGRSHFRTNSSQCHMFGLEPGYGCCTANFGQGWPKLALSAFMKSNSGIISAVPIPSEVKTVWNNVPVKVSLETMYPFRNSFTYNIESQSDTDMVLDIRIPPFARKLTVNGKPHKKSDMLSFNGFAEGKTEINISYDIAPVLESRPERMYCLRRGSLVFALPINASFERKEYTENGVERKYPYCDYYVRGTSDWNKAFTNRHFRIEECEPGDVPFYHDKPAIKIYTDMCHIDWGLEDGFETVCAKTPHHKKRLDEPTEQVLVPYGCTYLRMTELPLV